MCRSLLPFSLADLAGSPGAVGGAEVELVGSASLYFIEGYDGLTGPLLFGPQHIANGGGGTVSASLDGLIGVWSIDHWHNLYMELGNGRNLECNVPGSSPTYAQPYRAIPGVHPVIAELPPQGCNLEGYDYNPLGLVQ